MKKSKVFIFEIIGIVILIVLDRLSKIWAETSLMGTMGIDLIPGVLKFYFLPNGNNGAAFGMLAGQMWLFILITLFVVAALVFLLVKIPYAGKYRMLHYVFILIVAGGIGNLIDRIMNGSVVDFIYFYLINFPIFNVADCYVTVATAFLAVIFIFIYKEDDFKEIESMISLKQSGKNKEK